MKLVEVDKVEQAIKDYWKAYVDRMPTPYSTEEFEKFANRTAMCFEHRDELLKEIKALPPAQPERKKMSNKEWVDFLSEQFTVSRTSAREMLHGLMRWKAEDNFKKQFSGGRNESRRM